MKRRCPDCGAAITAPGRWVIAACHAASTPFAARTDLARHTIVRPDRPRTQQQPSRRVRRRTP